jgi:DNA repair exonuclease SbcCD ATPase subunit
MTNITFTDKSFEENSDEIIDNLGFSFNKLNGKLTNLIEENQNLQQLIVDLKKKYKTLVDNIENENENLKNENKNLKNLKNKYKDLINEYEDFLKNEYRNIIKSEHRILNNENEILDDGRILEEKIKFLSDKNRDLKEEDKSLDDENDQHADNNVNIQHYQEGYNYSWPKVNFQSAIEAMVAELNKKKSSDNING